MTVNGAENIPIPLKNVHPLSVNRAQLSLTFDLEVDLSSKR